MSCCIIQGSSSIFKKYLMAFTGFIMVGFLLIHMLGNLQMFKGPDAINAYAHFLKTLPWAILWGFRGILLFAVIIHAWVAILLTRENRAARPRSYIQSNRVQATMASRMMGISGSFILFFVVFHILHFTTRIIFPEYQSDAYYTFFDTEVVFNVYQMVVDSFLKPWVVGLYFVCMVAVCLHLQHAVWSMFQTLGWLNQKWRPLFKGMALAYAWVIFLGFMAVPVGVMTGLVPSLTESSSLFLIEVEPFDAFDL
jgi:succinate dehydrogenase / fumarate reductase cytochrome b subunit